MHIWAECGNFFRECRRHFHTTGAILPSSRFLARALVRQLRGPRPACRILEVGPGTGSVTCEIARRMLPGDRLDAVEINAHFVAVLRAPAATGARARYPPRSDRDHSCGRAGLARPIDLRLHCVGTAAEQFPGAARCATSSPPTADCSSRAAH